MEPRGSMPHSQGHSNNPCPEPNQPNSSYNNNNNNNNNNLWLTAPKGATPVN